MVFPLGLGTRIRRFPAVTVAVCLLWAGVALLDNSEEKISFGVMAAVSKSGLRDSSRALFREYCRKRKPGREQVDCDKYQVLVWTGIPKQGVKLSPDHMGKREVEAMTAEIKAAEKARSELSDCGAQRRCFESKDIVWSFLDLERRQRSALAGFAAYRPYLAATGKYQGELRRICQVNACLFRHNINLRSLFAAQVRHAGLAHLLTNALVFIFFCIYVEQRTNRLLVLLTLAAGGTIGMWVNTAFFGDGETVALGGSANVACVMGMFYVFFFQARMRLPVLGIAGVRRYFAPVKWIIPLVFVLDDIVGGLDNGFADLGGENVAHFAHLTGFAVGAAAAFLIAQLRPVPPPLLYEFEIDELRQLQQTRELPRLLVRAEALVALNPDNVHALEIACMAAVKFVASTAASTDPRLAERARHFLVEHLQTVLAVHARRGEPAFANRIVGQIPVFVPLRLVLGRLGQVSALTLADTALRQGQTMLALRLYDYFLGRYPLAVQCRRVEDTCASVLAQLSPTPANAQVLGVFLSHHADSQLASRIGAWLSNIHLGKRA